MSGWTSEHPEKIEEIQFLEDFLKVGNTSLSKYPEYQTLLVTHPSIPHNDITESKVDILQYPLQLADATFLADSEGSVSVVDPANIEERLDNVTRNVGVRLSATNKKNICMFNYQDAAGDMVHYG